MITASLVSLIAAALSAAPEEPAWAGFRGPAAKSVRGRPAADVAPTENIAWQARLTGYGQSSPVVCGDQVFVTSVSGAKKESYHVAAGTVSSRTRLPRKTTVT